MKKEESLVDKMRHAACHCEGQFDAEWEAKQLRDGADEIERLHKIEEAASRIVQQTNAERAYLLHDELIVALEVSNVQAKPQTTAADDHG